MKTRTVTREQVIDLAQKMPIEKLVIWYEYGLFIESGPLLTPASEYSEESERELAEEFAAWEAASDEDWMKVEQMITGTA